MQNFISRDQIVQAINNGAGEYVDIGPAIKDALERCIGIHTPITHMTMDKSRSCASITPHEDGSLDITFARDWMMMETEKKPHVVSISLAHHGHGHYTISEMKRTEGFSDGERDFGDSHTINNIAVMTHVDLQTGEHVVRKRHLLEDFCESVENIASSAMKARYEKQSKINDQIRAAQSPEDIAEIVEEHKQNLMAHEALEGDELDPNLRIQLECLMGNFDFDVSTAIVNAKTPQDFIRAADLHKERCVLEADKEGLPERTFESDAEGIHWAQRNRAKDFGAHAAGNPIEATLQYLEHVGKSIADVVAVSAHLTADRYEKASARDIINKYGQEISVDSQFSVTAYVPYDLENHNSAGKDLIAMLTPMATKPADALQLIMDRSNPHSSAYIGPVDVFGKTYYQGGLPEISGTL